MYVLLGSSGTVGWTSFKFAIPEVIRYRSVIGEYEHSSSKNRGPFKWTPKHKVEIFSRPAKMKLLKF
jgi:hypothetical protein